VYTGGGVILDPGEALYLYTDGVTEALNEQGEQYSAARLEAYLRGASGASAAEFAGGTPPFDDITVMTLRYLAG
jgi:sigma-B regulation protein RsbU (phosphoserine phosphatase)